MPRFPVIRPGLTGSGWIAPGNFRIQQSLGDCGIEPKVSAGVDHFDFVRDGFLASDDGFLVLCVSFEPRAVAGHFALGELYVCVYFYYFYIVQCSEILADV